MAAKKKDFYKAWKKDNAFKKEDSPLIECPCGAILQESEKKEHARICEDMANMIQRPTWEPDL